MMMKTDELVEISVCYSVYAPERTQIAIMTLIEGLNRMHGHFLPLSWLIKALVGEHVCDGDLMDCIKMPYGSLEILVICNPDSIGLLRDALIECFPEIERVEVVCDKL